MTRRSRHTTSFKPHADSLEERAGASVLIPGELPSVAADHLHPAEDGLSPTPLNRSAPSEAVGSARTSVSYSHPSEDLNSDIKVGAGQGATGASASAPSGTDPAPAGLLGTLAADGIIRPLSLAPSASQASPGIGTILSPAGGANPLMGGAGSPPQSAGAGGSVSQGNSAPAGGVVGGYAAGGGAPAAAQPAGDANPPVIGYIAQGPAPANVGTGGGGAPASVHAAAGGAPAAPNPGRHAGAPISRYVATGGGSAALQPKGSVTFFGSSASPSGSALSAGSGSSDYSSSSPDSLPGSGSSDPASYSIHYTNESGGGTAKGKVNLSYNAVIGNVVGAGVIVGASVTQTVGYGSPSLSNQVWSVSGATPAYAYQVVPSPYATPDGSAWGVSLNAASFDGNKNFSFDWGEIPGANTVTLTATVTVNGQSENVEAKEKVYVSRPSIASSVKPQPKTWMTKNGQSMGYRGITWSFKSSTGGQFAVVQVINSGSNYSYVSAGGTTYSVLGGAEFPLLDNGGASTPWVRGITGNPLPQGDKPSFSLPPFNSATQVNMVLSMKDYVMYDGGAMWVPVGSFTWSVNAQIIWATGVPTITNIAAPSATQFAKGTAWPSWNGNSSDYTTWH
jgi:hypothetical protein